MDMVPLVPLLLVLLPPLQLLLFVLELADELVGAPCCALVQVLSPESAEKLSKVPDSPS
jgi:hypothetical protein